MKTDQEIEAEIEEVKEDLQQVQKASRYAPSDRMMRGLDTDVYIYECPEGHATYWENTNLEDPDAEYHDYILPCEFCGRSCKLIGRKGAKPAQTTLHEAISSK